MTDATDEDLMVRIGNGDRVAFGELVRRHLSKAVAVAQRVTGSRGDAEEIAQEAFLRLYQNLDRIESPEHLAQWLRKVTWRCGIDEVRRAGHGKEVAVDDLPEPAAAAREGDLLLEGRLRALVASLPPRARMMVVLRYQEDLSLAEIADVMGIPLNTVKSGLARAVGVLREKLTRVLGDVRYETA